MAHSAKYHFSSKLFPISSEWSIPIFVKVCFYEYSKVPMCLKNLHDPAPKLFQIMYGVRNLEMSIRFSLKSLNDFLGQKCLKLKLRSAFVPT